MSIVVNQKKFGPDYVQEAEPSNPKNGKSWANPSANSFRIQYNDTWNYIIGTPVWNNILTQSFSNNAVMVDGLVRNRIPATLLGDFNGTKIKLTVDRYITASWTLIGFYVGHPAGSGDEYDFDGNQAQIKWGGNAVPNGGTIDGPYESDEIDFVFDQTKDLILSIAATQANNPFKDSQTGVKVWYQAGLEASVGVSDVTMSYGSFGDGRLHFITSVDVL